TKKRLPLLSKVGPSAKLMSRTSKRGSTFSGKGAGACWARAVVPTSKPANRRCRLISSLLHGARRQLGRPRLGCARIGGNSVRIGVGAHPHPELLQPEVPAGVHAAPGVGLAGEQRELDPTSDSPPSHGPTSASRTSAAAAAACDGRMPRNAGM